MDPAEIDKGAVYRQVVTELWRRGELNFKFHATQRAIYAKISASPHLRHYLLCSRRLGKTFLLICLAFEYAIRNPGSRILYLAPFAKDASEIASDTAAQILQDCPEDLRPELNGTTKEFRFKNGSIIRLKGVNNEGAQFLRGGTYHLVLCDEVGTMDDFKFVLDSVVAPMTMTTDGKILIATTPAATPGHDSAKVYEDLAGQGATSLFTVRDAPHITLETKARYLVEAGEDVSRVHDILAGKAEPEGTTAQREYFCWWVTDASQAVLKEFTSQARQEIVRLYQPHERPEMYDTYVSMDPGMVDRTGILFAYYDFLAGKIVVEDEALLHGPNTRKIAETLKEKEAALWGFKTPHRVSDVELRLIADLYDEYKLVFNKVQKAPGSVQTDVNLVRLDIQSRRLVIHPRCENLIRQMQNAIWNKQAKDFERLDKNSVDGHFDLVAALKYLCRSIARNKNPYPANYYLVGGKLGPPAGSYVSPKLSRQAKQRGLMVDSPLAKRLSRK